MDAICCGGVCCWFGVLCENCIVDASISHDAIGCLWLVVFCVCDVIFLFCLFCQVHLLLPHVAAWLFVGCVVCVWWLVCSLLRAHGGCLGMLSR